jgi:hypothetical protein
MQGSVQFPAVQAIVNSHEWVWAVCQVIHYVGVSLIVGIIGTLDLRVLGLFKSIPIAAFRPLVPWAIGAFIANLLTGIIFIMGKDSGTAYFFDNLSFRLKMLFVLLAFINLVIYKATGLEERVYATPAGANAAAPAKAVAVFSLFAWILIIFFGRTLQYNDTLLMFLGM